MSDNFPVHILVDFLRIRSSHGDEIYYYLFAGYVNWSRCADDLRLAFAVFVEYQGRVNYQMSAHILDDDFDLVAEGLNELRGRIRRGVLPEPS
jgi:hypothetical protein